MRGSITKWLVVWSILVFAAGSAHAQSKTEDDPSRFLANPLLAKAAALVPQSGHGSEIKAAFNKRIDDVRLMVLLSPT